MVIAADAARVRGAGPRLGGRPALALGPLLAMWGRVRPAGGNAPGPIARLTRRQREDLALTVGEGLVVKEAAARLGLSLQTTKNPVSAAYSRLGVENRMEAARVWWTHGGGRV